MSTGLDDDTIRATVIRLARPRADGGHVIERAAILAAGGDAATIESWILAHAGQPEEMAASVGTGLHAGRFEHERAALPRRFLLPPGALTAASLADSTKGD
jgi:hypothetical protein